MMFLVCLMMALACVVYGAPTIAYYEDGSCSKLCDHCVPGMLANPMTVELGKCTALLKTGFSIEIDECEGPMVKETMYPKGCDGAAGDSMTVPLVGQCLGSNGVYAMITC